MSSPEENRALVLADAIQREAGQLVGLLLAEREPDPEIPERPTPGPIAPPLAPRPYFDVGDATGKPSETVEIHVEAGCLLPMTGFHVGGGVGKTSAARSGSGKFKATGAVLGEYLRDYLKDAGAIHNEPMHRHDHFFSRFNFYNVGKQKALPEEWWEFMVGMFSIDQERRLDPVPIPSGTHLFTLHLDILPSTPPGEYELTCLDEHYYTHSRRRRRDFMYTNPAQGFTKLETFGGILTVE